MTYGELISCLKNATTFEEVDKQKSRMADIIPQIKSMFDYDQKNHAHQYDLWEHCVNTVLNLPSDTQDEILYMAALLHDVGKPDCQCSGKRVEDTNKHYYGHPKRSMEIVRDDVIPGLEKQGIHLTEEEQRKLLYYVEYHDDHVSLRIKHLRRHLKMVSFEEFQNLMRLQMADAKAHVMLPFVVERIQICEQLAGEYGEKLYGDILAGK